MTKLRCAGLAKTLAMLLWMDSAPIQYFERAVWALHFAKQPEAEPAARSHLTAMSLHACQSLREALDQYAEQNSGDTEVVKAIKELPHRELIENVRNMDLHGAPLSVCHAQIQSVEIVSKPGKPITLTSSNNVAVMMQLDGLTPKITRSPKDIKSASVSIGGATVCYGCNDGKLIVHDFATGKDYFLLGVLREFLVKCEPLIRFNKPAEDGETATTKT